MEGNCEVEVIRALRKILVGPYGENKRLKLLHEIETQHGKSKKLNILSSLLKMVPLMKDFVSLRRLILLFTRRVIQLLDETEDIKEEKNAEILNQVKLFWSASFNQQAMLMPFKICQQWDPVLIDIVASLASVYVDLFIVTHEHADNKDLWSQRLYSWLTFDLNQRAIKTALLEVSCPSKGASLLLSPILRKILSAPLEANSHMDYVLHMLLVKKWSKLHCGAAIVEISQNMKAPENFIPWLKTSWKDSQNYIPEDKSLKGRRVSSFLLDLGYEAFESLTDMYCDCLKKPDALDAAGSTELSNLKSGEEEQYTPLFTLDTKGSVAPDDLEMISLEEDPKEKGPSQSPERHEELFIVDKKGAKDQGQSSQRHEEVFIVDKKGTKGQGPMRIPSDDDEVQLVKTVKDIPKRKKRKREASQTLPISLDSTDDLDYFIIPNRNPEESPAKKKRRKTAIEDEGNNDSEMLQDNRGESSRADDEDLNPLDLGDSDFEALSESNNKPEKADGKIKRTRTNTLHNNNNTEDDNLKSGASDAFNKNGLEKYSEVMIDLVTNGNADHSESDEDFITGFDHRKGKKSKTDTKVNKGKQLVLSDPTSSYFSKTATKSNDISVYDLTESSGDNGIISVEDSSSAASLPFRKDTPDTIYVGTSKARNVQLPSRKRKTSIGKDIHNLVILEDDQSKESKISDESTSQPILISADNDDRDENERENEPHIQILQEDANAIVVPEDNSDDEISFKKDQNVNVTNIAMEDEISRRLSDIRQSISKTNEMESDSKLRTSVSSRRLTRQRTKSVGVESTPKISDQTKNMSLSEKILRTKKANQETSASASVLRDWLRSPPQKSVKAIKTYSKRDRQNSPILQKTMSPPVEKAEGRIISTDSPLHNLRTSKQLEIMKSPSQAKSLSKIENYFPSLAPSNQQTPIKSNSKSKQQTPIKSSSKEKAVRSSLTPNKQLTPIKSSSKGKAVRSSLSPNKQQTPVKSSSKGKAVRSSLSPNKQQTPVKSSSKEKAVRSSLTPNKQQTPVKSSSKEKMKRKSDESNHEPPHTTPTKSQTWMSPTRRAVSEERGKSASLNSPDKRRYSLRSARKAI